MLGIVTDYSVFYFTSAREALREGVPTREAVRRSTLLNTPIVLTAGAVVSFGVASLDARDARLLPLVRPRHGDHGRDGPRRLGAARAGAAAAARAAALLARPAPGPGPGARVAEEGLASRDEEAGRAAARARRLRGPRRGGNGAPQRAAARAAARRGPAGEQPGGGERACGGGGVRARRGRAHRAPPAGSRDRERAARARPAAGGARAAAARRGSRRRERPADRAPVRGRIRAAGRSRPLRDHLRQRPDRGSGDRAPRAAPAHAAEPVAVGSASAARPSGGAARPRSASRPCRRPTRRSGA